MVRRISRSLAFDLHFSTSDRVPPRPARVPASPPSVEFFAREAAFFHSVVSQVEIADNYLERSQNIYTIKLFLLFSPFFLTSLSLSCNVPS